MYLNLKKKYFLTIFSVLVLLTPLFYYIFSLIVILDCTRTKIIKYLTYPIYNIYEPNRKAFCKLTYLDKHKLINVDVDSKNLKDMSKIQDSNINSINLFIKRTFNQINLS